MTKLSKKRIYVAGHGGMAGSALVRRLQSENCEIVTARRAEADLTRQDAVEALMARSRPDIVFVAAAKVGGILANDRYPADFLYQNLTIETNILHAAFRAGVEKLIFLGSSCIYPRLAPQPLAESALLTGPLEPTNEWYAIAKIAGVKLCQAYRRQHGCDFVSVLPTNLYGPGDNYDLETSHVAAALLRRFHEARLSNATSVTLWGTGKPRREFLHVDDMADACVFLAKTYSGESPINVGAGSDVTIRELADLVAEVVGWRGHIGFDPSKPDGTPRKLLDISRLSALGWRARIPLREGLQATYRAFHENRATGATAA